MWSLMSDMLSTEMYLWISFLVGEMHSSWDSNKRSGAAPFLGVLTLFSNLKNPAWQPASYLEVDVIGKNKDALRFHSLTLIIK